jgi:hypothetical protein
MMKRLDKPQNKKQSKTKPSALFKKLKTMFSALSTGKKVQAAIASALTLALLIILPVYAWFALNQKMEAFTKIKEPDKLNIRAGHYDPVQYFSLNEIDIEAIAEEGGKPHCVVFSVSAGDYKIPYQIQLAYTTNIPFKYQIYRATELKESDPHDNPDVTYISKPLQDQGLTAVKYTFYYKKKGDAIELTAKNPDETSLGKYGRTLALGNDDYYDQTYDTGDEPEIYAIPIYEQTGKLTYDATSEHDYYILEISWDDEAVEKDGFTDWNSDKNQKETDMIYLTVSRYTE